MAKLHFIGSVMNAGKSAQLLLVRHNYVENGGRVMLFTSATDDRHGVGRISSRAGMESEAYALARDENIFEIVQEANAQSKVTAVLIDEVQFMTSDQVIEMSDIVDYLDIPVMAYGLVNNFQGQLFSPAIETMIATANEFKFIKSLCHCGSKATMILRYNPDGSVVRKGEVVETGGENRYVSVCRPHWKEGNIGPNALKSVFASGLATKVVCQTCESEFKSATGDEEQAGDCAAKLVGSTIHGYYGSVVADGCEFEFANGVPPNAKQGVICDACIRSFLLDGALLKKSSFFENIPARTQLPDDEWLTLSGDVG